jgi:hypothetical protein
MNQSTLFRFLVVASILLALLGPFVDLLVPGLLPSALEDAYESHLATAELDIPFALAFGGFSLILLIGAVAGTVGLLLFKRWSRPFSLWLSVLSMPSYPLMGPVLYSGWSLMITGFSLMLWGAALAMAYFSDVSTRFERSVARA